jgi:hypothetical protein
LYSLAEHRVASSLLAPKLKQEVDPQEFPPLQSRSRDLDWALGADAVVQVDQAFQDP